MTDSPTPKPFGVFVLHDLFGRVAKVTGLPGVMTPLRAGVWSLTERPFSDLVLFGLSQLYYVVTSDDGEVTEVMALPWTRQVNLEEGRFRLKALLKDDPEYLSRLPEALPVSQHDKEGKARLDRPTGYVVLNTRQTAKSSPYLFKAGSALGLYADAGASNPSLMDLEG